MKAEEVEGRKKINIDGQEFDFSEFSRIEACRHVFKHVLSRPAERWQEFYGAAYNLAALKTELEGLKCKGYEDQEWDKDKHGPHACKNFTTCNSILEKLCPVYLKLAFSAIREGAYEKDPRHTHNIRPTNFFLSDSGVLAETYENTGQKELARRSAYRVWRYGRRPPRTTLEFVNAAKSYVHDYMGSQISKFCTEDRWRPRFM